MATKNFKAALLIGGKLDGSFGSMVGKTQAGLKSIGDQVTALERKQKSLGSSIQTFGKMGKPIDGLREKYVRLGKTIDDVKAKQAKFAAARSLVDANNAAMSDTRGRLGGAVAQTAALGAAVMFPVRAAVNFETAMLGVAKQVDGARDASGRLTGTYYTMRQEILKLGHELPLATNEIAEMVEAGARMGVAREELVEFTRTAAKLGTAFDAPVGEMADSMGKIAKIFRVPISQLEQLGDTINYLDDNAISKGSDIIKVMQGDLAGAATTIGLTDKNAAALASTFLTLGESAERADTAASGMLRQLQIAKMNPKRFQVGVKMIGMTAEQLQKGMIADPQAMILDVLGRIKGLKQEDQMEVVTRLFGKDWGGAIAKLANNTDEYKRQIGLANGERADGSQFNKVGSVDREFQARMQSTSAQWQVTKNRAMELGVSLGEALLPAVNSLMKDVSPLVTKFADWSKENPGVIKGVVGMALGLSVLRVGALGAKLAFHGLLSPVLKTYEVFRGVQLARAGVDIAKVGGTAARVVPKLMMLGRAGLKLFGVLKRVGTVVRIAAVAFGALGAGPLLVIGAVAAGAFLVIKYWTPIKAFFISLWDGITKRFNEGKAKAIEITGKIGEAFKTVWEKIKDGGRAAIDWILGKFNELVTAPLRIGNAIRQAFSFPPIQIPTFFGSPGGAAGFSTNMGRTTPGPVSKSPASPAKAPAGRRSPAVAAMASPAGRSTAAGGNTTVNAPITIYQQPGEGAGSLARRVAAELKKQQSAAQRSRYQDEVYA